MPRRVPNEVKPEPCAAPAHDGLNPEDHETLVCYLIDQQAEIDLGRPSRRRDWMDQTEHAFAYRCLPLTMANTRGWEIRCRMGFEAEWNGGNRPEDVRIVADGASAELDALAHFGHGILTFAHRAIFRTPLQCSLWVSGPANRVKDAIQPLSGFVEADWIPFPFTMNWKFTRPNTPVRFEKGEPYCQMFAIPRDTVSEHAPRVLHLQDDPGVSKQYDIAHRRRAFKQVLEKIRPGYQAPDKLTFQGWYTRGVLPDGSTGAPDH